jgi:hypothetical protein
MSVVTKLPFSKETIKRRQSTIFKSASRNGWCRERWMDIVSNEKKQILKYLLWLNLALGLQNLYFFVNNESLFNFLVGALNIGVWVFFRNYAGNRKDD